MERIIIVVIFLLSCVYNNLFASDDPINSIIADISYKEKYGSYPSGNSDESDRIKTHLSYVLNILKGNTPSGLTDTQLRNRVVMITLLEEYIAAGKFPRNYDHPGKRIPCFIDSDGNICAVGYLVAETAGYETAQQINKDYKYSYINEMDSPLLEAWVEQSGLTSEECAMIQPTYGYHYGTTASPEYITSTAVLSGVNLTLSALNTVGLINHSESNIIPVISTITGTVQIISGISSLNERNFDYVGSDEKILTAFNIALGSTSILTAILNFIDEPSRKVTGGSRLNLTTIPITKDKSAYGVKFSMDL